MSSPVQAEAVSSILMIFMVIVVMISFSMMLSNAVATKALKPLERLLALVRSAASLVFQQELEEKEEKKENLLADDDDDSAAYDSEMLLMERAIAKLGIMAEQRKGYHTTVPDRQSLKTEEKGILDMIHARDFNSEKLFVADNESDHVATDWNDDQFGITKEVYNSWDLFTPDLKDPVKQIGFSCYIILEHPGCSKWARENCNPANMMLFCEALHSQYLDNPYHNYCHAIDVCFTSMRMMRVGGLEKLLSPIEHFGILVAAIGHDVAHPGVNNPFLIDTHHELALRYNDKSPLENMHSSKIFEIALKQKKSDKSDEATPDIFSKIRGEKSFPDLRKLIVEAILHTDMAQHFTMLKELQLCVATLEEEDLPPLDPSVGPSQQELDLLQKPEVRKMLQVLIVHAADVSNPAKSWDISYYWSEKVLEEFFNQGDQEKALGIPVQMLNDRDKVVMPSSQIGFIEFVVAPLWISTVTLFPQMYQCTRNLADNCKQWADVLNRDTNPSDAEKEKLANRINALRAQTDLCEARLTGIETRYKGK